MAAAQRPSWFVPTPTPPEHFDYLAAAQRAGIRPEQLDEIVRAFESDYPGDLMLRELHILRACNSVHAGRTTLARLLSEIRDRRSEAA